MVVRLNDVRLAFSQNLFVAGAIKAGDKPKFSCCFLMPKGSELVATVNKAVEQVALEKWVAKTPAILKGIRADGKLCFKDGDTKAEYNGYEGAMVLNASNSIAPVVVDRDRSPLTETSGRPYAGCYVNASVDIWAQDNEWGKRINASLRAVQFLRDGDAFAGSAPANAETEFDDVSDSGDLI